MGNTDWILPALDIATTAGVNIGGGIGARKRQRRQQEYTRQNMRAQQNWAKEMASTAYQRTTADMRNAGLNPLMMYGGSSGASPSATPSGSAPQGAGGSAPGVIDTKISEIANSAQQRKVMKQSIQNLKVDATLKKEMAETEWSKQISNMYKSGIIGKGVSSALMADKFGKKFDNTVKNLTKGKKNNKENKNKIDRYKSDYMGP